MNALSALLLPNFTLSRMKFFSSLFGVIFSVLWLVFLFEGINVIESEELFITLLLLPIYLLYAGFIGRYNDIGKYQTLVYIFIVGVLIFFFIFSYEIYFNNAINVDDDVFFNLFIIGCINLVFGFFLMLFGAFKKGQVLEKDFLVFLSTGIGRLSRDDVKKVDKNHHPDFSTNGLLVVHEGKIRTFTSEIDYDLVQPANLNGAQMFEFSLSAVK